MPEQTQIPAPGSPEAGPPETTAPATATGEANREGWADPLSAMTPRFNFVVRGFAKRFFSGFDLDDSTVERLRQLEADGAVIYVMRYASRLDYFLFNALFRREGLRLSSFANGIRYYYYQPFWAALRVAFTRRRGEPPDLERTRAREFARNLTSHGQSFFLFMRTARLRSWLRGRRSAVEQGKSELDLLGEVVGEVWHHDTPVHLVPLALFWRKGPRARRRFLNLTYGSSTRPSDLAKVTSFLTTYRGLFVKVGEPIDLGRFVGERRAAGPRSVTRMVRRSILMFLYREEKVVEGPTLRPLHRVQEEVLREPRVQAAVEARATQRRVPVERARFDAGKMFREIAANMNSTFLAILDWATGAVSRRLFASIDVSGIEKVAEYAKRHPLVLVPSHRSYFDFVIISRLFYANHLVPPHIVARENMAFGPFGFLFRRAGAYFMRRSFDDPLYKEVFRSYVAHLIREGHTQEFFIEGGRSRTGKTLSPRLGVLNWNIEGFLSSARPDLFFVPIAIAYERLVEEGAIVGELQGESKEAESMLGLVRARKYLRARFGSVFVNFGEPISLGDALGRDRARFAAEATPEDVADKRAFVERLGNRIAERINWAVVPNATSVAACALLGERRRGQLRADLVQRMQEVVDLLRLQDVRLTPALEHDRGTFDDAIGSLLRSDLLRTERDPRGEILYFEESRRRALDLYRNAIIHFLAAPSFLARSLLSGASVDELRTELAAWLDLFYYEFFTPRGEVLAAHFDAFIDHFERHGWIERREEQQLRATEKGVGSFRFLAEQTRGSVEVYYATVAAALGAAAPLTAKELRKAASEQFDRAHLLGEVALPAASNPVTFANAIDVLVRRGVLERSGGEARDQETYAPGASFDDLAALRERLAAVLSAG